MTRFDTIIAHGRIVDGTGAAARNADIGIRDGLIVAVEPSLAGLEADTTIDATERIVTPGFVDVHTHYDGQATWDGLLEPSTHHGVTTVVMGNCGVGFAPVRPTDHEALIELMEGVEDIPGAALSEGITWGWESFPEYLDVLSRGRWAVDVGTQLPHGPLRTYVMGPTASDDIAAPPDQIAEMGRLARDAVEAGAFGFTTSRTLGHKALDGSPVPGTFATLDELSTIAREVADAGGRVLEFAGAGLARSDPAASVAGEFEWLGRLAADTGVSTTFILLQNHGDPDRWRNEMRRAAEWRSSGSPVFPLVAGRPFGVIWGWDVRHPFSARPTYQALAHLPLAERLVELRDPDVKTSILSEDDRPATRAEAGQLSYIRMVLGDCHLISGVPDHEQPRDRTIGALAEERGATPEEVAYDGLLVDGAMILYALYNYATWDHSVLYEQLQDRDAVVALADGGAHVAFICDASIPSFMLTHWARDRSRGPKVPLPEVVRRLTSQPADLYGLTDRGRIEPGRRADINVIDHAALTLTTPSAVHDLPVGGTRLLQPATGYDVTMVAGEVTRCAGVDTGARPGRLLRSAS
jgi:N-acyl-D-aspartate/D-glutamate deacylase